MQVVLVPGGLYEDIDGRRFWVDPGILAGLRKAGLPASYVDRLPNPRSWDEDAAFVAERIDRAGAMLVAGSSGVSTVTRIALERPSLVGRLVLCWPATARDPQVDAVVGDMIRDVAGDEVAATLQAGETLRGITDAELATLDVPVTIIPCDPENLFHQQRTVDALARLLPNATVTEGTPESPTPGFAGHRDRFVSLLVAAAHT